MCVPGRCLRRPPRDGQRPTLRPRSPSACAPLAPLPPHIPSTYTLPLPLPPPPSGTCGPIARRRPHQSAPPSPGNGGGSAGRVCCRRSLAPPAGTQSRRGSPAGLAASPPALPGAGRPGPARRPCPRRLGRPKEPVLAARFLFSSQRLHITFGRRHLQQPRTSLPWNYVQLNRRKRKFF